ncbi:helix-turn-helix domain-containing protein [Aeromicrobium sp. Leaf350]|uniref:helix-turn-helix domain-containing protein n=1 Tax=Aeromicrobium sp. Leaf350 TaxID=2876565 RepID=UPI001E3B8B90|nr:helix-turn-helix transcriptional regulator [Aeromicrobium sp. Leaf350]
MTSQLQITLGRKVREHRLKLGLSQEALAAELGFHRTYLGSIERGERNLSLASVEQLARLLGVPPLSLLQD